MDEEDGLGNSDAAYDEDDISRSSLQGTPLWLLMMSLNLFFTGVGAAIQDWPCEFTNQSRHDIDAGRAVYGVSITLYFILGIPCLVINQFDTRCGSNMRELCQKCVRLQCRIKRWTMFCDIIVLMAGGLYLVSDNLALVTMLDDHLTEYTHFTYEDLRSILLGLSLTLGIASTVGKLFSRGLLKKEDAKKKEDATTPESVPVEILAMITNRLFPMMMYTVQVDQIYTTIASEVVHHAKEIKDGTKCPKDYVTEGILFFVAVSVIWIVLVCGVIGKHVYQLRRFYKNNSEGESTSIGRHIVILLIFWPILALYTLPYIALNNRWPWICAAKCQLEGECIEGNMAAVCGYTRARIVLLFLLWYFTTFGAAFFYFICRCAAVCGECIKTVSVQIEESLTKCLKLNCKGTEPTENANQNVQEEHCVNNVQPLLKATH